MLTPKIPCGFWTKLGSFGHSWRNHFPQKFKYKKTNKVTIRSESCFVEHQPQKVTTA
jgi:hypothetical protein